MLQAGQFRTCSRPHALAGRHATAPSRLAAHAAPPQQQSGQGSQGSPPPSIDLGAGWSVELAPSEPAAPSSSSVRVEDWEADPRVATAPSAVAPGKKARSMKASRKEAASSGKGAGKAGKGRTVSDKAPYVNMNSEAGMLSLELLKQKLYREAGGKGLDVADMKRQLSQAASTAREVTQQRNSGGKVGPSSPQAESLRSAAEAAGLARKARRQQRKVVYVDDFENVIGEEDEDEDVTDKPAFSLTIGEEGTEFSEYDKQGAVLRRASKPIDFEDDGDEEEGTSYDDEDDDDLDFSGGSSGSWGALARTSSSRRSRSRSRSPSLEPEEGAASSSSSRARKQPDSPANPDDVLSARQVEALLGEEGAAGAGSLLGGREQEQEEQDWGLEEISDRRSQSLMEQLGVVKPRRSRTPEAAADDEDADSPPSSSRRSRSEQQETIGDDLGEVQWGGSGGLGSAVDLEEQEAILTRLFKPHKVKRLMSHQRAAINSALELKRKSTTGGRGGKYGAEAKLHRQLRIIGGSAINRKLLSSQGSQTRPMMEKVRAAIFSMIQSQAGNVSSLPEGSRWLDLYAGTGSVGLEAVSRGSGQVHFVEMDPWVVRNVLGPNITTCSFNRQSVVHTTKAETFLQKARSVPRFAGGAFDFISVCPPYLHVSYPELFSLLEGSPLLHDRSIMFVEYPRQLMHQIPDTLGSLAKVRDRKYGRTWVAVYAPAPDDE